MPYYIYRCTILLVCNVSNDVGENFTHQWKHGISPSGRHLAWCKEIPHYKLKEQPTHHLFFSSLSILYLISQISSFSYLKLSSTFIFSWPCFLLIHWGNEVSQKKTLVIVHHHISPLNDIWLIPSPLSWIIILEIR